MKYFKRSIIIFFILVTFVGCDQATKILARRNLPELGVVSLLNDTFRLQYIENSGAFLGMGDRAPEKIRYLVFTVLTGACLSGVLIFQLITKNITIHQTFAMSLILGGGIGNLIDRIFNHGRVVDFMNLGIGSLRTGIFNVADMVITLGAAWLLLIAIRKGSKPLRAR